jgi:preprotein translocase subunit SecA
MAGRGTDIKLGEGVKEAGGLHIIGTERHESRRIDLQLRGRSGRQGDPGSSRFYLSLEDDLMRLFGSDRVAAIMDRLGVAEGEVIAAGMVTRAISNAQKKVETRNFGIRKHLLEYDDVMNQQRQVVYDIRNQALHGENMKDTVMGFIEDFIDDELSEYGEQSIAEWDWNSIRQNMSAHLMVDVNHESIADGKGDKDVTFDDVRELILEQAQSMYAARESLIPSEVMRKFERFVILRTIDEKWKDHLYAMDQIREGINLRAYGQKNPLLEYKSEGFGLFQSMMKDLTRTSIQRMFRTQIQGVEQVPGAVQQSARNVQIQHQDTTGMGFAGQPEQQPQQQANRPQSATRTPIHVDKKLGRNDKIKVIGPDGKEIEVKFKKLQQYLNQGYTQVS